MVKLEYFYKGLDNHNKLNKTALGAVNYYCPFKIVDDGFTPFLLFALTLDKGEQLTFRKMNTNKTSLGGVQLVNVVDIDISVLNDIKISKRFVLSPDFTAGFLQIRQKNASFVPIKVRHFCISDSEWFS